MYYRVLLFITWEGTVSKIIGAEQELNRQIDALVDTMLEVGRVIQLVESIPHRLILEKRYLSFLSWETIAVDIGYSARWLQGEAPGSAGRGAGVLDGIEGYR